MVLVYVLKGGLTSAIYTEVLQFFMIVLGFAPVVYLALKDVGGWDAMNARAARCRPAIRRRCTSSRPAQPMEPTPGAAPGSPCWPARAITRWVWTGSPWCSGWALCFPSVTGARTSWWCSARWRPRTCGAARRTPLIAAVPKMLFPALVIVPGMIAVALMSMPGKHYRIPPPVLEQKAIAAAVAAVKEAPKAANPQAAVQQVIEQVSAAQNGISKQTGKPKKLLGFDQARLAEVVKNYEDKPIDLSGTKEEKTCGEEFVAAFSNTMTDYDYDGVILSLVKKYCPTGLLGLALTALLASFMSGMAGNVTAFNTVWTYDLYQAYMAPNKSDQHYFWMGQAITVVGILLEHRLRLLCQHV